ncbi:MAG: hypothetical protein JNK45_20105, partial [Myxococcales bacterium]|nr:hypothetical protein [Myxococcales bacterium]
MTKTGSTRVASRFRPAALVALVIGGLSLMGCARDRGDTTVPGNAPRTVIAEPGAYDDIYVADSTYVERTTTTTTTTTTDGSVVGYDTLSDGSRVEVVTYVHSYPEPIETFPRVYWGGRWYYNINGDFVFYSDAYGGWTYYWGPPSPLVACWNGYYPWAPYSWGVGFYGPGWYWGGVGYYGYHAYGLPVVNESHHHHHHWSDTGGGNDGGKPSAGAPSHPSSPGGPAGDGPRRTKPAVASDGPRRTKPGAEATGAGNGRTRADAGPQRAAGPTRDDGPSRVANAAPTRATPDGGSKRAIGERTVPVRTPEAAGAPDRVAATSPGRVPPTRAPGRSTYVTSSGQRVTVIDPQQRANAPVRAVAPSRSARTIGSVPAANTRDPFSGPSRPRWDAPVASPSRGAAPSGWDAVGAGSPSRSGGSASPSRSAPSRSAGSGSTSTPSRSYSPSRSASPSRSYSPPSRSSAPSRSSSPSRS